MSRLATDIKSPSTFEETTRHWKRTKSLAVQAQWISAHIDEMFCVTRVLFADEDFLILLRAESLPIMPSFLRRALEKMEPAPMNGSAGMALEFLLKSTCTWRGIAQLRDVPDSLSEDSLRLIVASRYFEVLLSNNQINRFLEKHHAATISALEKLLLEVRDHRYTAA